MLIETIIFFVTTLMAYYLYVYKRTHHYFEQKGVRYAPGVPIFGNLLGSTFLKRHVWQDFHAVYEAFPDERYVGFIEGTTPSILVRDPELIKNITVKDFDHFVNHKDFFVTDPLFGGSVFSMKDDKWRDMRTTLSPAFTGSKMRHMMAFMMDISNNTVEYLRDHQSENINVDDLIHRYANDAIASAGFGLQVNSLKVKDNEFYTTGQSIFKFTWAQRVNMLFSAQFPNVAKKIGFEVFPAKTVQFFKTVVSSTMEYRLNNNVERPDMIQLLMEASKGTLKHIGGTEEKEIGFATTEEVLKPKGVARKWSENELAAQVFIFFIAGFESSANALTMCIHELAINLDVQERLHQELTAFKKTRGNLLYEYIGELKYLDGVVNETLRKWSAAIVADRVCTKPYELPPPRKDGMPYKINTGDLVYNAINSVHMDPQHYPDPEKFDPERFSDENKHLIKPFTYIPFGAGPRNCIASRFALLELKVLIYNLVLSYRILKCEKTSDPIQLSSMDFNMKALGGTWVRFQARE